MPPPQRCPKCASEGNRQRCTHTIVFQRSISTQLENGQLNDVPEGRLAAEKCPDDSSIVEPSEWWEHTESEDEASIAADSLPSGDGPQQISSWWAQESVYYDDLCDSWADTHAVEPQLQSTSPDSVLTVTWDQVCMKRSEAPQDHTYVDSDVDSGKQEHSGQHIEQATPLNKSYACWPRTNRIKRFRSTECDVPDEPDFTLP